MYRNRWNHTKCVTVTAMFAAIIFLFTFTGIGIIPLPFLRPTTLHIPVIVGALLLGPKYGAALGFTFGLASMLFATFFPGATSFVFSPFIDLPGTSNGSLMAFIVAFIPRILVGIVAWYVFAGFDKILRSKKKAVSWAAAGLAGALTNTLLVLHFIFLFFGETWNAARATPSEVIYWGILSLISINGIPESIMSAILVPAIISALVAVISRMPETRKV